jgi:hypothetical protein
MREIRIAAADDFEYWVCRAASDEDLQKELNNAAEFYWVPFAYSVAPSGAGTSHFVILRRNTIEFEARVQAVKAQLDAGEFEDDREERRWADDFLAKAKAEGYDVDEDESAWQ